MQLPTGKNNFRTDLTEEMMAHTPLYDISNPHVKKMLQFDLEFPDLKKRTVAEAIVRKLGERISVMGSEASVS